MTMRVKSTKSSGVASEAEALRCASSNSGAARDKVRSSREQLKQFASGGVASGAAESDTSREDTSTADGGSGGTNSSDEADEFVCALFNAEMTALQHSTASLAETFKELQAKRRQLQELMGPDEYLLEEDGKLGPAQPVEEKPKYKAPQGPTDKRGNGTNGNRKDDENQYPVLGPAQPVEQRPKYKAPQGPTDKRGTGTNGNQKGDENQYPEDAHTRTALQPPRDMQRTPLQAPRESASSWTSSQSSKWSGNWGDYDSWKKGSSSWGDSDSWGKGSSSSWSRGWHSDSADATEGHWRKALNPSTPSNGLSELASKVAECFGVENVGQTAVSQSCTPASNLAAEYHINVQLHHHPGVASPLQLLEHFFRENLKHEAVVHLEPTEDGSQLSLVHNQLTDKTCWEHVSKGFCPRQSRCRWEHPAPIRYIFSLTWPEMPQGSYSAMPTEGQYMQVEGCSSVLLLCSSSDMPMQYDGAQIQAALDAAQPEYYED